MRGRAAGSAAVAGAAAWAKSIAGPGSRPCGAGARRRPAAAQALPLREAPRPIGRAASSASSAFAAVPPATINSWILCRYGGEASSAAAQDSRHEPPVVRPYRWRVRGPGRRSVAVGPRYDFTERVPRAIGRRRPHDGARRSRRLPAVRRVDPSVPAPGSGGLCAGAPPTLLRA